MQRRMTNVLATQGKEKSGSVKVQDVSEPDSREFGRSLNPGHTHNIAGQKESDKEHLIE